MRNFTNITWVSNDYIEPSKTLKSFLNHIDKHIEDGLSNRFMWYMYDYEMTYYNFKEGFLYNNHIWEHMLHQSIEYDLGDMVDSITNPIEEVYEEFKKYLDDICLIEEDMSKIYLYQVYVEHALKEYIFTDVKCDRLNQKEQRLKNYLVNNYFDELITPIQSLIRQRQSVIKTIRAFHMTGKPPI